MLEIFFGYALFASAIATNKLILLNIPPSLFVALRAICAGLFVLTYATIQGHSKLQTALRNVAVLTGISVLTMFLPSLLKAYALHHMNSSKATLIGSLDPCVTAIFAYLIWGERITYKNLVGILIGIAGIGYLLTSQTSPSEIFAGPHWYISLPEIAAFGSMAISRLGWMAAQSFLKRSPFTPFTFNGYIMLIAGLCSSLFAYCTGALTTSALPDHRLFWILFTYTTLIGNVGGYGLYSYLLRKYPITLLSFCGLSVSLFVHLYGPIVTGEPLSRHFFIAFAIVTLGMFIFFYDRMRKLYAHA